MPATTSASDNPRLRPHRTSKIAWGRDGLQLTYNATRMRFYADVANRDPSALRGTPVGSIPVRHQLGVRGTAERFFQSWHPANWGCTVNAEVTESMARKLVGFWDLPSHCGRRRGSRATSQGAI